MRRMGDGEQVTMQLNPPAKYVLACYGQTVWELAWLEGRCLMLCSTSCT
jgi:hypothetical protein